MATDNSATPTTSPGLLPWAGKMVSQEHVEDELTSLWHLAADNMRISHNMNVRTSVLNLVICTQDMESAQKASSLLRDLTSTHIARVTLLILDTSNNAAGEDVTTWVTIRSFPIISDIMRHHFEQITVQIRGAAIPYASAIIQPYLKPDLPIYLWWLQDLPDDNGVFKKLIQESRRVIIDSDDFTKPEEKISTLSSVLQELPDCALSDLNWGRITAWRELVAQFFDVADYRPYLAEANRIEIEYAIEPASSNNQPHPHPIGALLLAAWMKTRLSWFLSDNSAHNQHDVHTGTHSWYMNHRDTARLSQPLRAEIPDSSAKEQESLHITIRPRVHSGIQPGSICLMRTTGKIDGKEAHFSIERMDGEENQIQTLVTLPESTQPLSLVSMVATHKESTLLLHELEIMGRDYLYEETLHEVFELLNEMVDEK